MFKDISELYYQKEAYLLRSEFKSVNAGSDYNILKKLLQSEELKRVSMVKEEMLMDVKENKQIEQIQIDSLPNYAYKDIRSSDLV
jgi:hypothetical protein